MAAALLLHPPLACVSLAPTRPAAPARSLSSAQHPIVSFMPTRGAFVSYSRCSLPVYPSFSAVLSVGGSQFVFGNSNSNGTPFAMAATATVLRCSFIAGSLESSFFRGEAGITDILMASGAAYSCTRQSGGALAAQMNIFERLVRIVRSYANAIISSAEDPEKLLDQTVLEMNEDLTKLRQASAQVLASQKQLENKYKSSQQTADDWYRRAKLALDKGNENLAREALKRRKDYESNAQALKSQLEQQKTVVEKLISNSRLLESKIQEAKSKKDTLKARAQSAKTAQKVNEMLGNINTSSALAAFEKMEEKVASLEAEADALNQLSTDDLDVKFSVLESGTVDADLAALKSEMLGTSKRYEELPAGRSPLNRASSKPSAVYPFRDIEIEKELNELRRKTTDF